MISFCYFFLTTQFIFAQAKSFTDVAYEASGLCKLNFRLVPPLKSLKVTSPFGFRIHPITGRPDFHSGVDLAADHELVYAIADGIVIETSFNPLLGNYIKIDHTLFFSVYGHLSYVLTTTKSTVTIGQIIGLTGGTGRVTGNHLHFSIIKDQSYVNPLLFIFLHSN